MRICLIHNLYGRTARGGAERVVEMIAKELVRQGHSVFVISTVGSWGENLRLFLRGGWTMEWEGKVRVYRVATANFAPYSRLASVPAPLRLLWHLFDCFAVETRRSVKKILKKERSDVVMTHNLMGLGFLLPQLFRRLKMKHIHTLHDVQLLTPSGLMMVGGKLRFPIAWALLLYERMMNWLVGSPDVVVSPSRWLLDEHRKRGFFERSRCVVLQNPTSPPLPTLRSGQVPTLRSGQVEKGRRPDSDSTFHFLYVGQLEKHKGVDVLLKAFKELNFPEVLMDIVGEGSQRKELGIMSAELARLPARQGMSGRVTFHGRVEGDALHEMYEKASVVVVPSIVNENTPTVITEAYSHGVPVIASRVGGIPEMVDVADNAESGQTGWLVPPGDVEALRDAMRRVYEQRDELPKMVEAIRKNLDGRDSARYVKSVLELLRLSSRA